MTGGNGDVEWLDDAGEGARDDEELAAGSQRPPLRRRTRLALGALAAVVLAGGVVLAVTADGKDRQQAAPTTRTVVPSGSSSRFTAVIELPQRAPRAALLAIRTSFPTADLTGFSAAIGDDDRPGPYLAYNLRAGRRLITITVGPPRLGDADVVRRTTTSLQLAQLLGRQRIDILLRTERGAPTARDFAAMQRLVQDVRLLATT